MKLHALMIAVALAVGSTFALAANEGAGTGPNGASAATSSAAASTEKAAPAKHMKKVSARHHRRHHRAHARAERREHMARMERREHLARAEHHRMHLASRSSTRAMGAGRYSPSVDLNSPSRERRMDAAYNDWLRTQGRR